MPPSPRINKSHYVLLAALRHELRRFAHFSEAAARRAGLEPRRHPALLGLLGSPRRDHASIGELAERLQLRHHSAVGLVDRLVRRGLVRRTPSTVDRRRVEIRLTARRGAILRSLSSAHLRELRELGPEVRRLLRLLPGDKRAQSGGLAPAGDG